MSLNADRNTLEKEGISIPVPVAANVTIFAGALVVANATGFAQPGAVATGLTYLGRADQYINNAGDAAGAQTVLVKRGRAFYFNNSATDPVGQASQGKPCYVVDDQTVSATNGSNTQSPAGIVIGVDAGGVWVL